MRSASRYLGISGAPESSNASKKPLPGCPTRTTGVPNKNHRGVQQVVLFKVAAKWGFLCRVSGALCFCFSCNVMLLNNNYKENGEVVRGDRSSRADALPGVLDAGERGEEPGGVPALRAQGSSERLQGQTLREGHRG